MQLIPPFWGNHNIPMLCPRLHIPLLQVIWGSGEAKHKIWMQRCAGFPFPAKWNCSPRNRKCLTSFFFLNNREAWVTFAHVPVSSCAGVTPACSLFLSSGCVINSLFFLCREIIIFLYSKAPFQIRDANGAQNCLS